MQMYRRDAVDSTLLEAKRIRTTVKDPFAVVSRLQTGGLGRLGRVWESPEGGLWYTLAWPLRHKLVRYASVPLLAGLALARVLERRLPDDADALAIKWPNDLLLHNSKVAGILCQSTSDASGSVLFIGIGLNLNFDLSRLPADARYPATTVAAATGVLLEPLEVASELTKELSTLLTEFEQAGLEPFLHELRHRLAWIGHPVRIDIDNDESIEGELVGLDGEGLLLVFARGETISIASGDVNRVRRV